MTIGGVTVPGVCDPNCKQCSTANPAICLVCGNGFTLSSEKVCTPCASQCKTCSSTPATCTSCYSNAFLDTTGNTCIQCTPASNCLTCAQATPAVCLTCLPGHTLQEGVCKQVTCPLGCLNCASAAADETPVCSQCREGFALSAAGVCVPCLSNCRHCSAQQPGLCLDCGRKFTVSGDKCVACPANCQSCNG